MQSFLTYARCRLMRSKVVPHRFLHPAARRMGAAREMGVGPFAHSVRLRAADAAATATTGAPITAEDPELKQLGLVEALVQARCHYGHKPGLWNPQNSHFIAGYANLFQCSSVHLLLSTVAICNPVS